MRRYTPPCSRPGTTPVQPSLATKAVQDAVLPHYPSVAAVAHITGKLTVSVTVQSGRVVNTRG
jgi:hypothetical protein